MGLFNIYKKTICLIPAIHYTQLNMFMFKGTAYKLNLIIGFIYL